MRDYEAMTREELLAELESLRDSARAEPGAAEENGGRTTRAESDERYRIVSGLISDYAYAYRVGEDGTLVREWVTGALTRMTGYTLRELRKLGGWTFLVHEEDVPIAERQLEGLLRGDESIVDYRIVTKDGTVLWVRDYARPVLDPGSGRVVRVYGATQNITERKEAEDVQSILLNVSQAVSESETLEELLATVHSELGRIIDTTNFYVALYDDESGTYTFPYHVDQYDDDQELGPVFLGRSLTDYVRRIGTAQMIDEPAFQGLIDAGEVELIGAPSSVWLGVPLRIEGKVTGVVAVQSYEERSPYTGRDFQLMTFVSEHIAIAIDRKVAQEERQRLEAQVRHAQKLESLGVLAGGIAHDFNNLLTGVLGNLELSLMQVEPGAPAEQSIREARSSAERAADLSRQMLAYSGKGSFVIDAVNVNELVTEIGNLLEVSVSKNVALSYDLARDLPVVVADATQLHQVVLNLVTNASDSIGEGGGVVTLRTGVRQCDRSDLSASYLDDNLPEGPYLFIEVSDTGCGMDEQTLQRIFDPFFTTKFTGRGLGLASALGIVRGHSGAIKVDSAPGCGTTFTVLLPLGDCEPVIESKPQGDEVRGEAEGAVLLVDDEDSVRDIGTRLLEQAGFEVVGAADGCQAVDYFRENSDSVACVLLDLTMPRMGGEETFRELKKIRSDVRVVLSSGFSEQEVASRFDGQGIVGFVQKPYRFEKLISEVQAAARGAALGGTQPQPGE
jgi:PAS domain S-box-containing protein